MNARRVLFVICFVVVGLAAAALRSSAPASTAPVEYLSWNDLIYDYELPSNIAPLAVKVSIEYTDPRQPGGYDPWDPIGNAFAVALRPAAAKTLVDELGVPNDAVAIAPRAELEYSDPSQPGGYDPWDPIGNAFGVSQSTAAVEGVWDDDGIPNNVVPFIPQAPPEWSDPPQPGGYDPWDPIGNSFGLQ